MSEPTPETRVSQLLTTLPDCQAFTIERPLLQSIHADLVRLAVLDKPDIIRTDDWGDQ